VLGAQSNPGEQQSGTAATFHEARADFERSDLSRPAMDRASPRTASSSHLAGARASLRVKQPAGNGRSTQLPRDRQLVTLEDAGGSIMKLPKAEQDLPEWQAAGECLILVPRKTDPP
jgi:hypothetical protein